MASMKVKDLIRNLQGFVLVTPGGADVEIMLEYDGDVCLDFEKADLAKSAEGPSFLVFKANQKGRRLNMKNVRIN